MFSIKNYDQAQILAAEKDFLLVYKPRRIHSAPERNSSGGKTLLDWCLNEFPEIALIPGRKEGEGGLLHRLDYETQGLMLIARNEAGMEALLEQQRQGKIVKEYNALVRESETKLAGFPEALKYSGQGETAIIKSVFRAYGPGRKAVRPVLISEDSKETQGEIYTTEILKTCPLGITQNDEKILSFTLRIQKGFRHQIRSHLAWIGFPILNDELYGGFPFGNGLLALRACSLSFNDPSTGKELSYSIPLYTLSDFRHEVK